MTRTFATKTFVTQILNACFEHRRPGPNHAATQQENQPGQRGFRRQKGRIGQKQGEASKQRQVGKERRPVAQEKQRLHQDEGMILLVRKYRVHLMIWVRDSARRRSVPFSSDDISGILSGVIKSVLENVRERRFDYEGN